MLTVAENQKRLDLYNTGLYDYEIAKRLHLAEMTVAQWRHTRGLAANGGSGWGGVRPNHTGRRSERRAIV